MRARGHYSSAIHIFTHPMTSSILSRGAHSLFWSLLIALLLLQPSPANAIKFALQAYRYPAAKCIWNTAHNNALVIVTTNVSPGGGQRVDVDIVDSAQQNVYLSKKGIKGETRFAVTAHAEGEVGVCFKNYLDDCEYEPLSVPLTTHSLLASRPR